MVDFGEQIEEIKALLSSRRKALAYSKVLRFQELSAVDSSALDTLVASSRHILASLVLDISNNDEEIAAQALKCLGFMIYHPDIVASIGGAEVDEIIASLVNVITTTKLKSVCNLGVWCISIQQFSHSLLDLHFQSLIRAINHALDNPIGSLSVTFEAMQAVEKLASSLTEKMKNMSSVWLPPIYRRLVSDNKRDRDMSERCLLKIMHLICPPPTTLSKALAVDMNKKLLLAMKKLLDHGMKIQSLRAWGWFIRLLGPYAIKSKPLINQMLEILEQTFSDFDSQVQIASLVAWEGLIDAIIEPGLPFFRVSDANTSCDEADRHLKRVKLIMAPLVGIMSSKCDASVHASCVSTWSYLLHKLGSSVSSVSMINMVWEPMIKPVFKVGPNSKNTWLWNFCLDLLNNLILGRNQGTKMSNQEIHQLSFENPIGGTLASEKPLMGRHEIIYYPWNLCQLDFFLRMISILIDYESCAEVTPESRRLLNEAALKLFGSLMETVQRTLQCDSITYEHVMQCLNAILGFLSRMCESLTTSEDLASHHCRYICIEFLKVVTEILGPSILESPLYKVGLDIKHIKPFEYTTEIRCATAPGICCMEDFDDRVLPIVHFCVLYFSIVVKSSLRVPEYESQLQQMQGHMMFLLSSYNPREVLHVFLCLLYKNTMSSSIQLWMIIVNCFQECFNSEHDQSILMINKNIDYSLVLHLLLYPFASWPLCEVKLDLQNVFEVWNLFYVSVDQALQFRCPVKSFSEDLCALLNGCIHRHSTLAENARAEPELQQSDKESCRKLTLLYGNAIIFVLKQLTRSISCKGKHHIDCANGKSNIMNSMVLTARFLWLLKIIECVRPFCRITWSLVMEMFWVNKEIVEPSDPSMASRFLLELVDFVGCLNHSEDILMLVENISSPLLKWLLDMHLLDENTNHQLRLLWSEILKGLVRSEPSLKFNSSFLEFQQPLLEAALNHPDPGILEATVNFWNSTYGAALHELEFPKKLLPLLDKMFRNSKIKIRNRNHCTERHSTTTTVTTSLMRRCTKRIEIVGDKRKRSELTEHQKEVRWAQQGRSRDCCGHGPGIRTYTSMDFSQGNEESQDSPYDHVRDAEFILEMLRRVH